MWFLSLLAVAFSAPFDVPADLDDLDVSSIGVPSIEVDPFYVDVSDFFPSVVAKPADAPLVVEREPEPDLPLVRSATLHRSTGAPARPSR